MIKPANEMKINLHLKHNYYSTAFIRKSAFARLHNTQATVQKRSTQTKHACWVYSKGKFHQNPDFQESGIWSCVQMNDNKDKSKERLKVSIPTLRQV